MKCKKIVAVAGFFALSSAMFAQNSDAILMKVGPETVTLSEFETIYKKNLQKDQKISKESLDEYLTLFTNFKLKVLAAKELSVDTSRYFKMEYNGYKKQLGANYMKDSLTELSFAKQIAERAQKDLHVSHILIKTTSDCDTAAAFKKVMDVYKKLEKGMKWEDASKAYSEDELSKNYGGDLGWFSTGMWANNFENAAYSIAKNGGYSLPIRSKSGYHIVRKIEDRVSKGEVKVAHIFVSAPSNDASLVEQGKNKINAAYKSLQAQNDWASVVNELSEDRATAPQAGELPAFGISQMVPEFEDAAFNLKNVGDYSEPVQTKYGWHIIKLLQKKRPNTFEEDKDHYLKRVQKSTVLSPLVQSQFAKSVRSEMNIVEYADFWNDLSKKVGVKNFNSSLVDSLPNTELFKINNVNYSLDDFKAYFKPRLARNVELNFCQLKNLYYTPFVDSKINDTYELGLEEKYPAFKALMKEFKEGMMQFELMKKEVWDKSIEDTVGLKAFFNAHRNEFMWGDRYEAVMFTSADSVKLAAALPALAKIATKPSSQEKVLSKINKKETIIFASNVLEEKTDAQGLIASHVKNGSTSPVFKTKTNYNTIVVVGDRKAEQKSLKEAKGMAISKYQEYLEAEWLKALRAKYPVEVDSKILYKLITR